MEASAILDEPTSPAIEEDNLEFVRGVPSQRGFDLNSEAVLERQCESDDSESESCGSDHAHSVGNLSNTSLGLALGLKLTVDGDEEEPTYCDEAFEAESESDPLRLQSTASSQNEPAKQPTDPCEILFAPGTPAGGFTWDQMDNLMQAIQSDPSMLQETIAASPAKLKVSDASGSPDQSGETMMKACSSCSSQGLHTVLYDRKTHELLQRLFQSNKKLLARVDQQTKLIERLQQEKKQASTLIKSLRCDLELQKQIIKNLTYPMHNNLATHLKKAGRLPLVVKPPSSAPGPLTVGSVSTTSTVLSPRQMVRKHVEQHSSGEDRDSTRPASTAPRQPKGSQLDENWSHARVLPPRASSACPTSHSRPRTSQPTRPSSRASRFPCGSGASSDWSTVTTLFASAEAGKSLQFRLEKLQEEKKQLVAKHEQVLADQTRIIARLEQDKEALSRSLQEREHAERLAKVKDFYQAHCRNANMTGGANARMVSPATYGGQLYFDDFWRNAIPLSGCIGLDDDEINHTDIGKALKELLDHGKLSFQDKTLHESTQQWLLEVQTSASKLLKLHEQFKLMAGLFQKLSSCSNSYQLAETLAQQIKILLGAEEAYVFVVDQVEEEFWCRVPRPSDGEMITIRSVVMPMASSSSSPACGFASYVYNTRKPLIVGGGKITSHPLHSCSPDNTDRLIKIKSASTLLVPVLPLKTSDVTASTSPLAVLQVVGKLHHVSALGIDICLEKCDTFRFEDQYLLGMVSNFVGAMIQKVAYFTDVESNKLNEETLLQLAPEIFTCLRFEDLGRIVIENAKSILDADRCSLFVADPAERLLHNWQSDISGGGVEVVNDAQKSGMTISFGQGIAGIVAETCQSINIVDAYLDERFNASWDRKTNYRTKSILSMPIFTTTATKNSSTTTASTTAKDLPSSAQRQQHQPQQQQPQQQQQQNLLGVVQVINKAGGAPFRANDEFILRTISKLIGLAIENSRLFQKNQELSANIGKLIAEADLTEAILSLGSSAEDLIGVEHAAIYILDDQEKEFYTFHRKRRHRIVLKEQMYRGSIFHQAIQERKLLLVNEIDDWPNFNAYIDSIGGVPAHNVLFAPLLKPATGNGSAFFFGDLMPSASNPKTGSASSTGSSSSSDAVGLLQHPEQDQLIGILHLVNTKGRKVRFEKHDLFLSIVTSQCCSVLASILDKQQMLRDKEDMTTMLETSMVFFKEMSPVGVINAVYNACACIFNVEKAYLFLWDEDHKSMWTSNLQPSALLEAAIMAASSEGSNEDSSAIGERVASAASTSVGPKNAPTGSGGGGGKFPGGLQSGESLPALYRQQSMAALHNMAHTARRMSMGTDHNVHISVHEGLLEQVIVKGSIMVVRSWDQPEDSCDSERNDSDSTNKGQTNNPLPLAQSLALASAANALSNRLGSSLNCGVCIKETLRSTPPDRVAGFIKHAVIACPVWDLYGSDIVGVLVLLYPLSPTQTGHPTTSSPTNRHGGTKATGKHGHGGSANATLSTSPQGVLVSASKGLPTQASELANLPFFSRQITGALNVCRDLSAINGRCRQLQEMMEHTSPSACFSVTFTLSNRGMLLSSSQPLNLLTKGFAQSHTMTIRNWLRHLQVDREGNRHGFQLTSASEYEMRTQHFLKWLGRDLDNASNSSSSTLAGSRFHFEKMRVDIQSAISHKESIYGFIEEEPSPQHQQQQQLATQLSQSRKRSQSQSRGLGLARAASSRISIQDTSSDQDRHGTATTIPSTMATVPSPRRTSMGTVSTRSLVAMAPSTLSPLLRKLGKSIVWQIREFLWEFMEETSNCSGSGNSTEWRLNLTRARELFDAVDRDRTGCVTLAQLERVWNSNARRLTLEPEEWQQLGRVFGNCHQVSREEPLFVEDSRSDDTTMSSSWMERQDSCSSSFELSDSTIVLDYELLLRKMQPQLCVFTSFQYAIHPVLDGITQSVATIQVVLTPLVLPAVDPLPLRAT